ncbi:integral membrane sensor signal transduction histidine kinase [Paenibacillus curdlanolyticus YK9]|uniref:Integral membrane sensor signal transduction histidine kinase n=1 Tax=Paenibacillus curdlanolyticus YK9 TaxID=717606 RepID=E0IBH4_9BACL|nr:sensor histidine kinase [Paenibacillus curdlanolyticus]EFM10054.1 integral membrane sensor signal transduction histidine kinase [Paenibacillus curdlanolyticus YK9]
MQAMLSRMSMLHRFLLLFILFVVIPVIFMYFFVTRNVSTITEKQVGSALLELVKTNHLTLERSMSHMEETMNKIMITPEIQNMVDLPSASLYERVRRYAQLDRTLTLTNLSANSVSYSFVLKDDNRLFSFVPGSEIQLRGIFFSDNIQTQPWYDSAYNAKGKAVLSLIPSFGKVSGGPQTLAMVKQMNDIYNGSTPAPGYLIVSGMEYLLKNDMAPISASQEGQLMLLDANHRVISLSDSNSLPMGTLISLPNAAMSAPEGVYQVKADGQKWLYAVHRSFDSGTTLLYRTPLSAVIGEHASINRLVSYSMLIYFLLLLFVSFYFIRSIVRPIARLARISRSYEPGEPLAIQHKAGPTRDELTILNNRFVDMVLRLNQTIHDKYELEIKQRESELAILHSQINPHLLYNTLESIYWRMIVDGNTESAEMVMDLSLVMRIGLSRGKELITIEEELQHAEAYVRLQLKRHEYSFRVNWDIEEEAKPFLIPKVVLQPLIENAIFHGIRHMDEEGELWIIVRMDSKRDIIVTIEDNGFKTIAAEAVQDIVDGRNTEIGYGIRNVNKRMQLHFGERYGLRYEDNEGDGIRAILHLPAMLTQADDNEGERHV